MHYTPLEFPENSSATELRLDRYCHGKDIYASPEEDPVHFVVGIGGHHAPPNVRLFSYVLPAIELAGKSRDTKPSLTLATSVTGALRYNYVASNIQERNAVYFHTRDKLACIFAFIQEFFPNVFSTTQEYYGDIQDQIPERAWLTIWDKIKKLHPHICAQFLQGIGREERPETIAYTIRHSLWFLDLIIKDDPEIVENMRRLTVSVGSENEIHFNSIRNAVFALPLDFLEETLGHTVFRREKIFQCIFPTGNPVPYGQSLKGKNGHRRSAEVELRSDIFPFKCDERLGRDVHYTVKKLEELTGATEADFVQFLQNI